MSAPIKREDIRKGDVVERRSAFTALGDGDAGRYTDGATYELIERPVVLPDVPGHYVDKYDGWVYLAADGTWTDSSEYELDAYTLAKRAPFTLLRPVAEVAAEVLEEMGRCRFNNTFEEASAKVEAKFGVSK